MRVSIVLQGKSRMVADLEEERAIKLYIELAAALTEELAGDKIIQQCKDEEFMDLLDSIDAEKSADEIFGSKEIEKPLGVWSIEEIKPKEIELSEVKVTKEPVTAKYNKPRRLLMARCHECGNFVIKLIDEKQLAVDCNKCRAEIELKDKRVAEYKCPNCGFKADFFVAGDVKEVKCKKCESNIDLIWNEKKMRYASV